MSKRWGAAHDCWSEFMKRIHLQFKSTKGPNDWIHTEPWGVDYDLFPMSYTGFVIIINTEAPVPLVFRDEDILLDIETGDMVLDSLDAIVNGGDELVESGGESCVLTFQNKRAHQLTFDTGGSSVTLPVDSRVHLEVKMPRNGWISLHDDGGKLTVMAPADSSCRFF